VFICWLIGKKVKFYINFRDKSLTKLHLAALSGDLDKVQKHVQIPNAYMNPLVKVHVMWMG